MRYQRINNYRRVNKTVARKHYNNEETVRICAVNLSPVNLWGEYTDANRSHYTKVSGDGFNTTVVRNKDFETVVMAFTNYNCNSVKGKYPAFYVREA